MHRNFCTLFDAKYCNRGLALYDSLVRHSSEPFTLHVLAMDSETFWLLDAMNLPYMTLYPLDAFERAMHMEPVKESRSWTEYCWTCASSFLEYLMSAEDLKECTYLDSDLFFFASPKIIFDEIAKRSIAIVPHRFPPERKYLERNGLFNVGWVTFRQNEVGMRCLKAWADITRKWCFHRNESGKFADQGYLDEWPGAYGFQCAVIQNIGVGVAPWNLSSYRVSLGPCVNGKRVTFYHYHEYQNASKLTNYPLRVVDICLIYDPYNKAIAEAEERIASAKAQIVERKLRSEQESVRA